MNTERTHMQSVEMQVVSHSNGIHNLVIQKENMQRVNIEISKQQAEVICESMNVEMPYSVKSDLNFE